MKFNYFFFVFIANLFFSSFLLGQDCSVINNDSCSLVQFYQLTNGANWSGATWDLNSPVTTWSGTTWIMVNNVNYVKRINLVNRGLSGDITNANLELSKLEELFLDNNNLTGQLPDFSATNLPKLKYLTLEANELTGNIPNFNLPTLEILALSENNLEGTIPNFDNLNNLFYLVLNDNQLSGSIPSFSQTSLSDLYVHNNNLSGHLPNFSDDLNELWIQGNQFTFHHLNPMIGHSLLDSPTSFIYAPQDSIGQTRVKQITIVNPEDRIDSLQFALGGDYYELIESETGNLFFNSTTDTIILENLDKEDDKIYHIKVTNEQFPALTLHHRPIRLSVIGLDFWGANYAANEVIVKFEPNESQANRDNLRANFEGELIKICQSDRAIFELWYFADPHQIIALNDTFNINATPSRIRKRSRINGFETQIGLNYQTELFDTTSNGQAENIIGTYDNPPQSGTLMVALIDSGIDESLFEENNNLTILSPENHTGNFVNPSAPPLDGFGHGTHLASLIGHHLSPNLAVELYPLMAFDEEGIGNLFDALCALYAAFDIEADIINFNWTQQSEYDSLLADVMEDAALTSTLLIIPSGNNGVNNNEIPSYPANFSISNAMVVQAINEENLDLASFSNYSADSVDVAMHGTNVTGYGLGGNRRNSTEWMVRSGSAIAAALLTKKAIYEAITHDLRDVDLKNHLLSNQIMTTETLIDKNKTSAYIPKPPSVSLPIQLIDFSTQWLSDKKTVQLDWKSSRAENFSHFEIERADENHLFENIGQVLFTQNDNEETYQFFDANFLFKTGTYFYRLKLMDKDGKSNYSDIQSVVVALENPWMIYPNPANTFLKLETNMPLLETEILIRNNLGQVVQHYYLNEIKSFNIDVSNLLTGSYILNIKTKESNLFFDFIKQ